MKKKVKHCDEVNSGQKMNEFTVIFITVFRTNYIMVYIIFVIYYISYICIFDSKFIQPLKRLVFFADEL